MKNSSASRSFTAFLLLAIAYSGLHAQDKDGLTIPGPTFYGTGNWNSDSLGNHRIVLSVASKAEAVYAKISWRRKDRDPDQKNIVIIDATTTRRVQNAVWLTVNREYGEVVFQANAAPGNYFVYYLIYRPKGSRNYPRGSYQPMEQTAESDWLKAQKLDDEESAPKIARSFPTATLVQFQSIDEFNSFYPMEVIATSDEVSRLLKKSRREQYLVFPEDRKHPIKMTSDLPAKWAFDGPRTTFSGFAHRGEFYSFQMGVYAFKSRLSDMSVSVGDLKTKEGSRIPSSSFMSFNTEGIDWQGKEFDKEVSVDKGRIQPLWMGFQIPTSAAPGTYEGVLTLTPKGLKSTKVKLKLDVSDRIVMDAGDSNPANLTRLRWLNSQIAADDSIVPPFQPVKVNGNTVSCLGRSVTLNGTGFPQSIISSFSPEVTSLTDNGREVLASPIRMVVEDSRGKQLEWKSSGFEFVKQAQGVAAWKSGSKLGAIDVSMEGQLEFDGYAEFRVTMTVKQDVALNDIRLDIPLQKDVAKYMMGMGVKGGFRPESFSWKWDQKLNQDGLWIGDVNAGLQCSFRDENYVRPLNTNFYLSKPLNMPPSWFNEGKGGFKFSNDEAQVLTLKAFSGSRRLKAGSKLHFSWSLLLTPFKLINTDAQWSTRFYHKYQPVKEIAKIGANTINVHHATDINPYINYPFLRPKEMKSYIDSAHAMGMKVKIYYTVRELSNKAPELFALRSFGDEVLSYGPGGGFSWLQEHLDSNYIAAWFVPELKDAAIINSGVSRWHNYYVEGLNWLVKNVGIDGLYIDDVAFDRTTMKRVRKVLDRNRPGALIDLHSANQFNPRDGFVNSAQLYLEHFPYIDRLWFGEYFDYDSRPDFWLTEISGIPFGLMGEMLEKGGNPWRGMVYGMTNRLPWAGDPTPVWKVWDDVGMKGTKMVGYWSPNCPVKTDQPDVLATAYVKEGRSLIALASWAKDTVVCSLAIDWKTLGLDTAKVAIVAPPVKEFQSARTFKINEPISVPPGKGWMLVVGQ
jgi:hypothetical protein